MTYGRAGYLLLVVGMVLGSGPLFGPGQLLGLVAAGALVVLCCSRLVSPARVAGLRAHPGTTGTTPVPMRCTAPDTPGRPRTRAPGRADAAPLVRFL